MIAASAIPVLIATIALAWLSGFCLVAGLSRRPGTRDRVRDVPSLMLWQVVVTAGVAAFVLVPAPVRWLVFLVACGRMVFEAVRIHDHVWTKARVGAVLLSPTLPLALSAIFVGHDAAAATLLLAFFLAEVFDSFSYLGGKVFGRRPLAPRLSPSKTWEGFLTGAAVMFAVALVLAAFAVITPGQAVISTLTTMVFAPVGDFAASFGKRLAGVKDYPVLITGQGGLLDMFDAWIYVAPLTAAALQLAS